MGTTIATICNLMYLIKYYIKNKKEIWKEIRINNAYKKERICKIVIDILKISIPMALCALFSGLTKTIDALTIVRILKNSIGEEMATIQYGILNGKIDTLIALPFSFNIAIEINGYRRDIVDIKGK